MSQRLILSIDANDPIAVVDSLNEALREMGEAVADELDEGWAWFTTFPWGLDIEGGAA